MAKLTNEQRRAVIVAAALRVARDSGIWAVAHGTVAKRCVVPTSTATVRHYFPTKDDLWRITIAVDDTGEARRQAEELGWQTSPSK